MVLLQLWGLHTLTWFGASLLGRRLLSSLGTIAVTVALALAVWEGTNAAVQHHLARLAKEAQTARSARLRTLLPLLRTTLFITIAVIVVLMVLSEIGLNIGPLLAGAGIVGVAIGFGSQKLVQDLINGIFLLLENAMQVGDFVTVSGLSGTVEALSVRTIRLRAGDGSVHIIPFSAVTSVTNTNRGLGNAAVAVTVAYDEDTDRVGEVLKAIAVEMREEDEFKTSMLSDLQLWGVDKVDATSATLAGQIVCTDSGRWAVQREFNRRVKRRFQALGIRMPTPVQDLRDPPIALGCGVAAGQASAAAPIAGGWTGMSGAQEKLVAAIGRDGFVFVRGAEMRSVIEAHGGVADWDRFAASWDDLGLDTYMADGGRYRKRRHAVYAAAPVEPGASARGAPAALSEPRLQPAAWRHPALVRAGRAAHRRERQHGCDPADLPRPVRAPQPRPGLACRGASVPHRGAAGRTRPADARGHASRRGGFRSGAAGTSP